MCVYVCVLSTLLLKFYQNHEFITPSSTPLFSPPCMVVVVVHECILRIHTYSTNSLFLNEMNAIYSIRRN